MMRTPAFRSTLAQAMTDLVAFKRLEGFDYTAQAVFLKHFDSFLCGQEYCNASLNRQIVDAYIAHTGNVAANSPYSLTVTATDGSNTSAAEAVGIIVSINAGVWNSGNWNDGSTYQ